MGRRRKGYAQLSNGFFDDTKIRKAMKRNPRAGLLFVMSISFASSNLTDGLITHDDAEYVLNAEPEDIQYLVDENMWEETDNGWLIHNYLKYNVSKTRVLSELDADSTRKKPVETDKKTVSENNPDDFRTFSGLFPDDFRTVSVRNPDDFRADVNKEQRTENINPTLTPPTEGSDGLFEQAWSIYPKHTGSKQQAKTLFDAISDKSQVVDAAKEINRRVQAGEIEQRYVPNMVRWLDNRTYLDYQPRKPETVFPSDQWVDTHVYARLPDGSDQFTVKRLLWKLIRDGTPWEDAANTIINETTNRGPDET